MVLTKEIFRAKRNFCLAKHYPTGNTMMKTVSSRDPGHAPAPGRQAQSEKVLIGVTQYKLI